jgi:hypothetical protein
MSWLRRRCAGTYVPPVTSIAPNLAAQRHLEAFLANSGTKTLEELLRRA